MAEEALEVRQLEILCKNLYESTNASERADAEKALVGFQNSPTSLNKCQLLLERGDSSYSQLLAATTLTRLCSRPSPVLTLQQRLDIRNYILSYLMARPKLAPFVTQALITLFARITKLGWFEFSPEKENDYVFRNVIGDVSQFLQSSVVEHAGIGVQLLWQLVSEMNQLSESDATLTLTKHRKIASSFRDVHLYEIFQLSCTLLRNTLENFRNMNFEDQGQHNFLNQLLRLAHNCLTYDFIGTSTDESSDDLTTVQMPTQWRPALLDPATLQLFFDLYDALPSSLSPMALSCLVQMAAVRRSLFDNAERAKFLNHVVTGVKRILQQNAQSLSEPNNYHEFCRLLARLKTNYQLGELVMVDHYRDVIQLIAKFTVESLQMWQFAPNSVHYLLSLWQRMVASVPYVKATEPHYLETYTPEVTSAYVQSRLEAVAMVMREGLEDPLDDMGLVQQQLEQISVIMRMDYAKTCSLLISLFEQSAQSFQELVRSPIATPVDLAIQEGRLTWLVYIIGAAIGGRVSFTSSDEHDSMDGELVCRVLQLMNLTDSRLQVTGGCEKLELAMLSFFEQFRKIYVGDQVQMTSKVYRGLSDVLGLRDESMVLSVFVRKIITNLKYWSHREPIVAKTLLLLNELCVGYSSVRKLVKLEEIQFILQNHTSEHFPFLGPNVDISEMKCRTTFYTSMGRLLLVDLGEDEDRFEQFMLPLASAFDSLGALLTQADSPMFSQVEEAQKCVIGLARDLRGLAFAFNTKQSYMMLFDWLYPDYAAVYLRALQLWYHQPQVTSPLLKLFAELVQNRSQRLQFDSTSPNGVLLFREASKVLCSYGDRILSVEVPKEQIYAAKFKGISVCFSLLKAALCGGYVNFGVFRLYGDTALDDALSTFVKMLMSIPQSDLLAYPKLSQTYYVLLECLAQDHMVFLSSLEPHVFLYILSTVQEGLTALDTMICTGCCNTLDHIVTYVFRQLTAKGKKARKVVEQQQGAQLIRLMEIRPELLQQMLSCILNIVMFEECRNQYSMSRPLLGLILLNEDYFGQLRQSIIRSQPVDKQSLMAQWFDNLMDGIERNVTAKNRDRFTQNLSLFRRDVNESLKGPVNNPLISNNDMMT
ncbi:hypothetical protein GHT06_015430 [Daphnia sinensis]|uniref:Importin N-terminal domain-containing protein n=1 Tax=Daphnia sinensis TaxID=1820382 RepID=A0AAD5KR85_9CRUS|nr:hypothetical protein GHT06_015430 [Daphnia sinensis]